MVDHARRMLTPSRCRRLGLLVAALTAAACASAAPSPVTRPAPPREDEPEARRPVARPASPVPAVRTAAPGLGIDRPRAIETWLAYELRACGEDRGEERCRPVADITTDEAVTRCRQGCDDTIAEMTRQTTTEAISLCVDRYVRDWGERGRASARCSVEPSRPYGSRVDRVACVNECVQQGEARVSALQPAPGKPAAPATAPARGGAGDEHLLCCDGTRSPTCSVGRASYRGCCSHHGGVC